jgi:hypothetical protein
VHSLCFETPLRQAQRLLSTNGSRCSLPRANGRVRRRRSPLAHLVELDALEEALEIAIAEAFVALALDDLEEDRPDPVLVEDLQQTGPWALPVGAPSIRIRRFSSSSRCLRLWPWIRFGSIS